MDKNSQLKKDAEDLKKIGYAQELFRDMGGFSNFALSFSIISILTGAIQLYGYGLQHGGPLVITLGWWLVSVMTLTVALSMAELASAYPTAGALYHWSSMLGGRAFGWFTACFNTIGQFAILAGIDYGLTQLCIGAAGAKNTLVLSFSLYTFILFSHATLNHYGIRLVSWLNDFSAWYHVGVVLLLIGSLVWAGFNQPVSFLFIPQNTDGFSYPYSFLLGLLLAQWTLTGYDASAHVSEETLNPRKAAPWGIFIAVVTSIIFGSLMLSAITLSIPDLGLVTGFGDNAFAEILRLKLGQGLGNTLVFLVLGAMWLCGLSAMTSASRMVYAFSRDGGLPFSKHWQKVCVKYKTPSRAIWMLAGVALLLAVSVKLYSAVVSVATVALYISYGLPILARLWMRMRSRKKDQKDTKGPWNLGPWSTPVAFLALLWISFICIVFILPPNFQAGIVLACFFMLLCGIWIFRARHNFKGPPGFLK